MDPQAAIAEKNEGIAAETSLTPSLLSLKSEEREIERGKGNKRSSSLNCKGYE